MNLTAVALLRLTMGFIELNRIPDDFKMGAASAAYQIEGAAAVDGRTPSIWDTFSHSGRFEDNGDIACDSYHNYLEDVQMLKYLGVDHYRFSISWSRVLPLGDISQVNLKGVQYYTNLIDALIENNIIPMVTLYHWDLPQSLEDIGGWLNPEIKNYFKEYARFIFQTYGDKVKYWFTINEPKQICLLGYGNGLFAPGVKGPGVEEYICGHNILKAHAEAYHVYDKEFRSTQNGRISIVIDIHWMEPATNSSKDIEAAERMLQFYYGYYANPVFHPDGNYPQIMIDRIAERSAREGLSESRLPKFTPEEIEYIKGTSDFFTLNTYMTYLVEWQEDAPIDGTPSIAKDTSVHMFIDPKWEIQAYGWPVVPTGLRKLLNWIDKTYNHPEIFIAENGYCDNTGTIDDERRINYYREYLRNVLLALYLDGVNVTGYTAWTLMDNYEWDRGYELKFGLYNVDFNDPNRKRSIKKSGEYYKQLIATRMISFSTKTTFNLFILIISIFTTAFIYY